MGGVARRAAVIKKLRMRDPGLILLSAGDFYAKPGIVEMYRSRFLSGIMIDIGYTAVALGEKELSYGLRPIKDDAERGLPVICANLYEDGKRVFPPFLIKEVSGAKVGIFSLLDQDLKRDLSVEIRDPILEGRTVAAELRGSCDYLILLAHMSRDKLGELLSAVEDIDMVIRGHAKKGEDVSDDCAETFSGRSEYAGIPVLFAGEFGKAIGMAGFSYDAAGSFILSDTTLIKLTGDMPLDPDIAERVREFGEKEGVRIREMNLSQFLSRDNVTGKISERYLGIDVCSRCHSDIMAEFMVTKHFRAFTGLTISMKETDPACLPCHTTGYGRFSGYDPAAELKGGINLQGVQCEACHGPGTKHSRDGKYKKAAVLSCRGCHTPGRSPEFKLDEYMKRFDHCAHSRIRESIDEK